ncbi:MAG: PKD domain-containing protein [Saprospiraceae bacterium]|nr:PKD domain-containing protein [Saprospiraceae bacterium]
MMKKTLFPIVVLVLAVLSCAPDRDDEFQLPPAPAAPDFSVEMLAGDSNRVVVKDLSEGNFQRLWDFPGGSPKTSARAVDTVLFAKKGEYVITLFVSKKDGSGSPSASKKVVILTDAPVTCTPKMAMLTGDCNPLGKCWTFSRDAGAVKVGPTYDDFSWYTSPANGLQNEQYDDGFCFVFENLVFQNRNNGASVNPWNGYTPQAYDPGVSEFVFLEGTGILGRDQIVLPDDQFMGVWDCDNVLDVVKLTATELIVRGRQRAQNGTPLAQGWFELRFVPQ